MQSTFDTILSLAYAVNFHKHIANFLRFAQPPAENIITTTHIILRNFIIAVHAIYTNVGIKQSIWY